MHDHNSLRIFILWGIIVISFIHTGPGPPSNVKGLCTVVLWGRPSQPNGKITGYEVQVYVPDEWYGPVHSKKETDIYHIVEDSDTPSEYNQDEFFVAVSALHTHIKYN